MARRHTHRSHFTTLIHESKTTYPRVCIHLTSFAVFGGGGGLLNLPGIPCGAATWLTLCYKEEESFSYQRSSDASGSLVKCCVPIWDRPGETTDTGLDPFSASSCDAALHIATLRSKCSRLGSTRGICVLDLPCIRVALHLAW